MKNRIQAATDTLKELWLYALVVLLGTSTVYSVAEDKSFWDSIWWAVVTAGTVGYGDQFPVTVAGRIAGIALIVFMVLVLVPVITARMSAHLIVDDNAWTEEEQNQVKRDTAICRDYLDELAPVLRDISAGRVHVDYRFTGVSDPRPTPAKDIT